MTVSPQAPTPDPNLEPRVPDDPMEPVPGVDPDSDPDREALPEPDADPDAPTER